MKALVAQAMEDGALGLSTSLQYVPDLYNSTDEIIAMREGRGVARRRVLHAPALGGKRDRRVARRGLPDRPRSPDPGERLAPEDGLQAQLGIDAERSSPRSTAARASGLDVAANQYPWNAGSNGLDACLPPWVREGGREKLLARLRDPEARARMRKRDGRGRRRLGEPVVRLGRRVRASSLAAVLSPELKKYEGGTLQEIARRS